MAEDTPSFATLRIRSGATPGTASCDVLVDGLRVGRLPLTGYSMSGDASGSPKVRVELIAEHVDLATWEP